MTRTQTQKGIVEKYGLLLSEDDEAPPIAEIMDRIAECRSRQRIREILAQGRYAPLENGFRGGAGYMGRGDYSVTDRRPGYLAEKG